MVSLLVCTQAAFPLRVNDFACWVDLGGNWKSHLELGLRGLSWGHLQAPIRGGAQVSEWVGWWWGAYCWPGRWFRCRLLQGAIKDRDYSKEQLASVVICFEEWTFSRYCVGEAVIDMVEPFGLGLLFVLGFFLREENLFRSERGLRLVAKECFLVFKPRWQWIVFGWEEAEILPNWGVWP